MSRTRCFNWDMRLYGTAQGWWDPSDSSTVAITTGVNQLNDKSGNARNAANADTGTQPPASTINGKGAIDLQGGDFLSFTSNSIDVSGGFRAIAVVDFPFTVSTTTLGSRLFFYDNGSATVVDHVFGIGAFTVNLSNERICFVHIENGVVSGYGQTTENISSGDHLLSFSWTGGSNVEYRINNTIKSLSTSAGGGFTASNRDPSFINIIGGASNPFGKVGEMLIYSTLNSNYSVSFVNTLLNHKWGVY